MKLAFFSFSLFLFSTLNAQPKYAVSSVSPALLRNAHVIKRLDEHYFELKSLTEASYIRKVALTILDEAGQDDAELVVGYDKLHKVTLIEGALFDAAGTQLKKVKGKEINDLSATRENLYDDHRLKQFDFHYRGYPYTVEYTVEEAYTHSFYFPSWIPQDDESQSVEKSSFTFVTPSAYALRYKAFNYKGQPVAATEKDKTLLRWEAANIPAMTRPFASPAWRELTPAVYFGPSNFALEGYQGNAASWSEFGKFVFTLFQNRDKLPDDVIQKATAAVSGLTDPKEKIAALYRFLQQNTRYISIQLGIGGWQPFDARYVAQKGYGDCKALTNYMYSLLKTVGIKSCPALVNSGYSLSAKNLIEDLPSPQFNHIVLFVPLAKDTVWLECTSQDDPAGYAGRFTGNRKALALTEEGGVLVTTPRYTAATNLQLRTLKGKVDAEGNLALAVDTRYTAEQQDYYSGMINALSKEQVKKTLNERLDLSTYEITDFAYKAKKDRLPEIDETLNISVANYATVSGRRLFLVPNVMNRSGTRHAPSPERTADYVFDDAYTDVDSAEFVLPEGYQLEAAFPDANIKTAYGNYFASVKVVGNTVKYVRKIERFCGRFPAREGVLIAAFFDAVYKADRGRIVLVKKEEAAKPGA